MGLRSDSSKLWPLCALYDLHSHWLLTYEYNSRANLLLSAVPRHACLLQTLLREVVELTGARSTNANHPLPCQRTRIQSALRAFRYAWQTTC